MHALRNVPADLSDLRCDEAGAQQPPGPDRADARGGRRPFGTLGGLCRRNVFLPGVPGVRDRVPCGGELRRTVRARARRGGAERRFGLAAAKMVALVYAALAVHGPEPPEACRADHALIPGTRVATPDS